MDAFINVIKKKDSKRRVGKKYILDRYNRLPLEYRSKIGYNTLIQNVILQELMNIMGTAITDVDIDLKMKFCIIKFLKVKPTHKFLKECGNRFIGKKKKTKWKFYFSTI